MDIITPTMIVPENQITLKEQNAVIMTWKMHLWLSAEFVGMQKGNLRNSTNNMHLISLPLSGLSSQILPAIRMVVWETSAM